MEHDGHNPDKESYKPLIVILSLIFVSSVVISFSVDKSILSFFANFMAGFFIVFSGFKLLDLDGFVANYSTYDLLAQKLPKYGYVYPFIELLLGLSYATRVNLELVNLVTAILMSFGAIGVFNALRKNRNFKCACLGTAINLPLSNISLIENLTMGAMAVVMLILL